MAEKLLFGVVEGIIRTLGSPAVKQIGLLRGVKDEIGSLRNTVSTIEGVLLDAEEKRAAGDRAVTRWLGRLEDVMYDADDLLDVVTTEALRREVMTRDKKAKKVRIFFSNSNQLAFRRKMARKIKAIRKRLDAIDADRQRFHLAGRHVEETRVGGNRETHGHVRAETVIGREVDKKAVIDRLLDSNVEDNVSILPIVAIGGLGKTTLAQLIFNDDQIQKHFQLKMWVCVSDPFNVKSLVEKILESATNTKQPTVEMNTLVNYLRKEIDGKKYFLILDDVWNEDHGKWSKLKEVLMGGARGSRILVTTRTERVARITGTVRSYSLRGLDKDDSWSLFKQMTFEKGQEKEENSSIVAIGKEILEKCSGVPLAIRTIGSLLRFKNPKTEWLSFKNNELSKISQNENDILPTLKLSYDHLPSHLKHCFAYCSLYPKDYWIHRLTLINLWIAQGFVKTSDQNGCLEEVGNEYFMDLLWRSFFQEVVTDRLGNVIRCKMHDLMHDLAISVAGSLITRLDGKERNIDEKTRHVSIVGYDINDLSVTTSLCRASSIRTFLCRHTSNNLWVGLDCEAIFSNFRGELDCEAIFSNFRGELDCEAICSSFKFLRVLDLSGIIPDFLANVIYPDCLPSCIGKLKHLRYLDLSRNWNLKKLPNSITRLLNLQTLKLSYCSDLEELPRDIKKLVNLRHLEIDGCFSLTYMPRGLGQLTNLQTLSKFVVHKDPLSRHSSGLKELSKLNNLRGRLDIENLRHGKDAASEFKAANLKEKQHLHALDLQWSIEGGVNDSNVNFDDEVLLEGLQPHPNLKQLWLQEYQGSRLPSWILSLTNLVTFELRECRKCQYLPPLSQLPSLKVLVFSNCLELELELANDEDGMQWQGLKSLLSLEFTHLPKLVSLPLGLQHATTLQRLKISNCENLTAIPEWIHNCTSLQVLEIDGCSSLTSLPEGMRSLTSLQRLEIRNCPILLQRCKREVGEDWPKIAHIPELGLQYLPQQTENSNSHASSTDPEAEAAEPVEAQKK